MSDRIPHYKTFRSHQECTRLVQFMFICSNKHLHHLRENKNHPEVNDAVNTTLKRLTLRLNRRVSVLPVSQSVPKSSTIHKPS